MAGQYAQENKDREAILNQIERLVGNFLYYDRKDDEDLPRGVIEEAVKEGVITVGEIVNEFRAELMKRLPIP